MGRFLAGVASALLLVAAGLFLWRSTSAQEANGLPAARAGLASPLAAEPLDEPPSASEKTREEKRFSRYDKDRNGQIARDEYLAARRKAFAKLDTNGDGKLSFEEYSVKAIDKFAKADADKSGTLSAAEFATTRVVRKERPRPDCPPQRAAAPAADKDDEG